MLVSFVSGSINVNWFDLNQRFGRIWQDLEDGVVTRFNKDAALDIYGG